MCCLSFMYTYILTWIDEFSKEYYKNNDCEKDKQRSVEKLHLLTEDETEDETEDDFELI